MSLKEKMDSVFKSFDDLFSYQEKMFKVFSDGVDNLMDEVEKEIKKASVVQEEKEEQKSIVPVHSSAPAKPPGNKKTTVRTWEKDGKKYTMTIEE